MQEFLERYSLQDLIELARSENVGLSERLMHDLPAWGLLPFATTEGRAPREGVGRYWTREQAIVFYGQIRARAAGRTSRGDLANIPVAGWLLGGESLAPLHQVRRALETWLRWHASLTPQVIERVALHTLRARPDVELALKKGVITRADLVAETRVVPPRTDVAAHAEFFGKLRGPMAERVGPNEQARRIANRAADSVDFDIGVDAFPTASDELLRAVRELYFNNLKTLLDQKTTTTVAEILGKLEIPSACASTFSMLGKVVQLRQQEAGVQKFVEEGVQASAALSSLFVQIENALRTSKETIEISKLAHAHRMGKRQRSPARMKRLK
jgi:hypothetical protein